MVECLTWDRGVVGSSLTRVTVFCPWARHINSCLALLQPRKTRPDITEIVVKNFLNVKNQIKQNKSTISLTGKLKVCLVLSKLIGWSLVIFLYKCTDMTQLPRLFVFCLQSADRKIYLVCTGLCLYRSCHSDGIQHMCKQSSYPSMWSIFIQILCDSQMYLS